MHSQAYQDTLFRKMLQMAAREAGEEAARLCIKCHAPLAYLSNEFPPADGSKMTPISRRGVQCDFCHTITGFEGHDPGDGNYIVTPGNVKFGPYDNAFCDRHKNKYSSLHKASAFCGICHQYSHPESDITLIGTYEDWDDSEYNKEDPDQNVECQHCHMSPGITKFVPRPGKNDLKGPDRKHVAMHDFIGVNSLFSGSDFAFAPKDFEEKRKLNILKRLRAAASLEITSAKKSGQILDINVKVGASGTGHKLPTGTPEREAWLEITVIDHYGTTLYQTEEPGHYKKGEKGVFRLVLGDKAGHETYKMWEAQQVLSDSRLKPKEVREVQYKISIPSDATASLTIKVRLLYRSVPPRVTDIVFGKDKMRAPVMEMLTMTTQVQ
jgi:hypothetical protein